MKLRQLMNNTFRKIN